MPTVDLILHNAIILTMDKDFKIFEPGALAVRENLIVAVGPETEILEAYQANQKMDCEKRVLMPGIINTHTHAPMTLLRGLADDLRLDVWLMGYMMPVEREFVTPEFVRLGTKLACAEMIRSGVTAFADMYYFEDAIAETTAEIGMRAWAGQTVMKFPAPDAKSYEESLALCEALIKKWKGHPLIVPAIAPHAVYTCPPEVLTASVAMAKEYDVPIHFHVAETSLEVENLRNAEGMPVVPYIKKQGMLDTKMLAAHCVFVDEGEIRTMLHYHTGIAHNPSSNLKLASGFAPVKRMLDLGCNVGIGTDGAASNNDLDLFEEIRLASFIAKAHTSDPTALPARQALEMATIRGAKAMHIDEFTGSLEPGKRADLITVEMDGVHNAPRFRRDPNGVYAQLIYAAKAADVRDVMVEGRWLMKERQLLTVDEKAAMQEAQLLAEKIDAFLKGREESVISKLIAIGGAAEMESFEVQSKVKVEDLAEVERALFVPEIEVVRVRHYHEYDNYFGFDDPSQGRLRYREDEFIDENGKITNVRSRLTLIGSENEGGDEAILLSRSRYLAPASHSMRFYTEYFKPSSVLEIEKNRLRYLIRFKETEFFVNFDEMIKPRIGNFIEVKSRTWSKQDAENKTALMHCLLETLGLADKPHIHEDYVSLVEKNGQ
ncbi:MAG: amidohydrolase [Anaerolineaceae bacterium]|nr:amidohydrolase [Anaerolineaceae bacterium]